MMPLSLSIVLLMILIVKLSIFLGILSKKQKGSLKRRQQGDDNDDDILLRCLKLTRCSDKGNLLKNINRISQQVIEKVGFFHSGRRVYANVLAEER